MTDSQGLSPHSMDRRSGLQLARYQIGDIVSYAGAAVKGNCKIFQGDWDKALQGLQTIFGNALSGLGNLAVAGFTAIPEIGTSIWPAIDSAV